ncbi:MAG: cysteine-rich CWC family protein [Cyclobacteriaceae bacterium]|nr:cysteine-rich CWC family protein [Cyclobacteriaceae bacterium]
MTDTHEKHERKFCPRCKAEFTCKVGDVANCQCSTVTLSHEEQIYLNKKFGDCLCAACMKKEKSEYAQNQFNRKLESLLKNGNYPSA